MWPPADRSVIVEPRYKADHRNKYTFDRVPTKPLTGSYRFVLTVTELPFLILWAYAAYWIEVCLHVGHEAPAQVWQSALVAGLLVGLGLNANAYRALRRPLSRSRKKKRERKGLMMNIADQLTNVDSKATELDTPALAASESPVCMLPSHQTIRIVSPKSI
eukprot:Gregarina_sp_Poly_1__10610@NODE_792_length_6267_cov_148_487258_g580_i0_p6_GENE_NODE_792_length_6267_cov_148_487258_g580_i0NODE_792_length_6267_cov_148_487258_g580_i0_p6_ORF_typecomplete_len161_score12_41DUF1449/PF07290_11/0_22_NODE_792_length_6267_cov_148_487258_g580_i011901672